MKKKGKPKSNPFGIPHKKAQQTTYAKEFPQPGQKYLC